MKYELPWGNLPPSLKLGSAFAEPLRLFRGDKADKIARGVGILSLAVEYNREELIYQFGQACEDRDEVRIRALLGSHTVYAHKNGVITPFVSASPSRRFAESFAQNPDEVLVEFEVPACRAIAGPFSPPEGSLPSEVLVIGGVLPEEIIALHDTHRATI